MTELEPFKAKIVLLGDPATGKTTLRLKYIGDDVDGSYLPTLGADFSSKHLKYANADLHFQIWDVSGQSNFQSIRKNFYLGAHGALVLYDITNRRSFENVSNWIDEFFKYNGAGKRPVVIIANKIDLRKSNKVSLTYEDGKELTDQLSLEKNTKMKFLETSALTGVNLDKAFELVFDLYFEMFPDHKRS